MVGQGASEDQQAKDREYPLTTRSVLETNDETGSRLDPQKGDATTPTRNTVPEPITAATSVSADGGHAARDGYEPGRLSRPVCSVRIFRNCRQTLPVPDPSRSSGTGIPPIWPILPPAATGQFAGAASPDSAFLTARTSSS
jgi:hypothetical protein